MHLYVEYVAFSYNCVLDVIFKTMKYWHRVSIGVFAYLKRSSSTRPPS